MCSQKKSDMDMFCTSWPQNIFVCYKWKLNKYMHWKLGNFKFFSRHVHAGYCFWATSWPIVHISSVHFPPFLYLVYCIKFSVNFATFYMLLIIVSPGTVFIEKRLFYCTSNPTFYSDFLIIIIIKFSQRTYTRRCLIVLFDVFENQVER